MVSILTKATGIFAALTLTVSAQVSDAQPTTTPEEVSPPSAPLPQQGVNVVEAPPLKVFNDKSLAIREYGFGVLGGVVSGALCFYIGSGLESAFRGSKAKNGTLEFTGIRYDNFHGAFIGGGTGLWLGSALTAYFVGEVDEEDGNTFLTLLGGAATTALAMGAASALGVNDGADWPALIPLIAIPASGAALTFNISRYYRDKKRLEVIGSAAGWQPPRLNLAFQSSGPAYRLDALRWTF